MLLLLVNNSECHDKKNVFILQKEKGYMNQIKELDNNIMETVLSHHLLLACHPTRIILSQVWF